MMALSVQPWNLWKVEAMNILVSLWAWIGYILVFVLLLPVILLVWVCTLPFDKNRRLSNAIFMTAGRAFLWFNPLWRVNLEGIDKYNPDKPMIFIANHQSFLDMVVLSSLPWNMKWVSKDGLFKVPVLNIYLRLAGHVSVKRGTTAALRALNKLKPYLADNLSVMLFPEGTRSRSGRLLKFKSGAFMLSKETNIPVQPVLISGTRDVMKPDTWVANFRGTMTATLMPVYYPEHFETIEQFRDRVFDDMSRELDRQTQN